MRATKTLHDIYYNGLKCETSFWLEELFNSNQFGPLPTIKQAEMGKEFEGLTNLPIEFAEQRNAEPITIQ
jgi:hypothetical protein